MKPSAVWDIKRIPVERESRVDEKENLQKYVPGDAGGNSVFCDSDFLLILSEP